ncbi:MAG: D-TA family PLP-dependent enzyme [Gemmatimonadaceae bacterium]
MLLGELETPVPIVDVDRLQRNLERMAAYASSHGLALRPHIKTHKSLKVAREQMRLGAAGLTCATPRELEVMSGAADDLLLAYPLLGVHKAQRVMALPRQVRLTVALDSAEAVLHLAKYAAAADREVGVYVELDVGMHRVGVPVLDDAMSLIRLVQSSPPLRYRGIAYYPGHIRQRVAEQRLSMEALAAELARILDRLESAGCRPDVVSGGSTPTMWQSHEIPGLTEIRPGTYVYNDRGTVEIGACSWDDCAFTVLATVVSVAVPNQAVIDAGSKALGREPMRGAEGEGFAVLVDRPDVVVSRMSEEHGILDLSKTTWRPRVGDQVRLVPNHVCVVTHLNDAIYGVRNDQVVTSWSVSARGREAVPVAAGWPGREP